MHGRIRLQLAYIYLCVRYMQVILLHRWNIRSSIHIPYTGQRVEFLLIESSSFETQWLYSVWVKLWKSNAYIRLVCSKNLLIIRRDKQSSDLSFWKKEKTHIDFSPADIFSIKIRLAYGKLPASLSKQTLSIHRPHACYTIMPTYVARSGDAKLAAMHFRQSQ
jgi:hypothetical protein